MKQTRSLDVFLRRATPLVLVVMAGLVWFERWIPGGERFADALGSDAVQRFVIGVLCLYILLLVIERERMEHAFKEVLGAFREFHKSRGAGGEEAAPAQRQAVQILIGALDSPDEDVRQNALQHLRRLTGEDHGTDAAAWRAWLDRDGA